MESAGSSKRVHFAECSQAGQNKRFAPEDNSGENTDMDPETAKKLFESGANVILLNVPPGTEIGIDMQSWRTGPEFKGIKMIPSGLHFIYFSSVSKEGSVGPRTGFFHHFAQREIIAKRFDPKEEVFVSDVSNEDIERFRLDLQNLDKNLGAYPYDSWKKWVSLSSIISSETVSRLEPISGQIHSVTELLPNSVGDHIDEQETSIRCQNSEEREANLLPNMKVNPAGAIRYSTIPRRKYPSGSTPAQITKYNMDASHQLKTFLQQYKSRFCDQVSSSMSDTNLFDEVLAELQFSFVCFLVGQHYDSFEHWKKLLVMLCTCEEAILEHPQLYMKLISEMYFQIREVPNDFFVDIVSSNNFLATILNQLFGFVRNNETVDLALRNRMEKFQAHLSAKFQWIFDDEEDEEDKPVVVDMAA